MRSVRDSADIMLVENIVRNKEIAAELLYNKPSPIWQ